MSLLEIKPASQCRYDLAALGEVMLRLDPGVGRVRTARQFTVWEGAGGATWRVVCGAALACAPPSAQPLPITKSGGCSEGFHPARRSRQLVDENGARFRRRVPIFRNGLNFTERGFGVRGAVGMSDRGNTAASQLKPGDFDWDDLFGKQGVRWLHTGGIFAALSDTTPALVEEAVQAAKRHGTIVSYDLNYRPSLWKSIGGQKRAQEVNRRIARHVDVMIGNEEDFTACLGFEVKGVDANISTIDVSSFQRMIQQAIREFPNFKVTATRCARCGRPVSMTGGSCVGLAAAFIKLPCAPILKSSTGWGRG